VDRLIRSKEDLVKLAKALKEYGFAVTREEGGRG
jgi:hypothetical protein